MAVYNRNLRNSVQKNDEPEQNLRAESQNAEQGGTD
jgi:hypothetical protein